MVGRQVGGLLERVNYMLWRREVRIADTEADYVNALPLNLSFEPVEFGEQVRRQKT